MDDFLSKVILLIVLISSLILFSLILNQVLIMKDAGESFKLESIRQNLWDINEKQLKPKKEHPIYYIALADFNEYVRNLNEIMDSLIIVAEVVTFVMCIMVSTSIIYLIYKYYGGTKTLSIFDSHSIANNSYINDNNFGNFM